MVQVHHEFSLRRVGENVPLLGWGFHLNLKTFSSIRSSVYDLQTPLLQNVSDFDLERTQFGGNSDKKGYP